MATHLVTSSLDPRESAYDRENVVKLSEPACTHVLDRRVEVDHLILDANLVCGSFELDLISRFEAAFLPLLFLLLLLPLAESVGDVS